VRALRLLLPALVALAAAAPAGAQTPPPPPPPDPPLIADGVTISGIPVGGLTRADARVVVETAFDVRLPFRFNNRRWSASPRGLGSYPFLRDATAAALAAEPGTNVALAVKIRPKKIRAYVNFLQKVFGRKAVDSRVVLRGTQPWVTKARNGRAVRKLIMRRLITRALARTQRTELTLATRVVKPTVTRMNIGPILVLRRESRRLQLWRGMRLVRMFPVAVGTAQYPTPLGSYRVVSKLRNPTWNPPSSPWAAGLGPVPPGPANPLGTRWIGTSAPGIGIHGTPAPWTVGTAASHGCIRMYMRDVEWLFERVNVGSPVFFVRA
jgi:lipoprotein-anchoring transpeptidase ErfK/SrfK